MLRFSLKYIPDASVFAVLITAVVFIAGIAFAGQRPMQMIKNWYQGFWELLAFSMQMALIVVTGSAVANAPLVKRGIRKIAAIPKTGSQAAWLVTFVAILVSFFHWGLSLVVGALLAKEVAKNLKQQKIPFEYGLIAAGAYVGQMTWEGMLSSSVGLSIATEGHILEKEMGIIPLSEFVSNRMNLLLAAALLIFPPLFAMMMHPRGGAVSPLEDDALRAIEKADTILTRPAHPTVGDRLNYSPVLAWGIGIMGWVWIIYDFASKGFGALDFNLVNFIFLFTGILLNGNIANYVQAVREAVGGVSGIIFQFPLYAGIQGMIKYSGLVSILSNAIVSISTPRTFYFWTFLTACIINMFIPSGGGHWAVQGPIAIASAKAMGMDLVKTSLMVSYGGYTNMLQPFWAIALLGVTGLKAKDIMGYSMAIMILSGVFYILAAFLPI